MDQRLEIILAAKDATGRAFQTATQRVTGFTKKIVNMQSVMVGAAGAAGLGYFVKKNLEAADSIAKTADAVGLSTTALQQYRFIADRAGVATSTLEQGLGAFSKRLGELRSGTGAMNTLLSKNNEELKNQLVAAKNTDEALRTYLEALSQMESQADRTAFAAAAFSRTAGIKMTNMVKGGTESLEAMREQFSELGLAIDEEFLRNSEKAIDEITDLEYAIRAKLMSAVVELAPEIGEAVGRMTDWVVQNDEFLTQDVPKRIGETVEGVKNFVEAVSQIPEPILYGGLGAVMGGKWGAAAGAAAGSAAWAIDKSVEAMPGVASYDEMTLLRQEIEKTEMTWRDYYQMTEKEQKAFIARLREQKKLAREMEEFAPGGLDARLNKVLPEARAAGNAAKNFDKAADAAEKTNKASVKLATTWLKMSDQEVVTPKLAEVTASLEEQRKKLLMTGEEWEAYQAIQAAGADVSDEQKARIREQIELINELKQANEWDRSSVAPAGIGPGGAVSDIVDTNREAVEVVETQWSNAWENIQDIGAGFLTDLIAGEVDGVKGLIDDLQGVFSGSLGNSIMASFTDAFKMNMGQGGGLMDALMGGVTSSLSSGNVLMGLGSAATSLVGGILSDEPSWWDKFRDAMEELREQLRDQTEATRANTRAMIDASPEQQLQSFLTNTEGQGRALIEEFRFPGPGQGDRPWRVGTNVLGRNAERMRGFLESREVFGGEDSLYQIFQQMASGNMEGIWPQEMREKILSDVTGYEMQRPMGDGTYTVSAEEARRQVEKFWESLADVNEELAETAVAKLEEMLARMQQELVQRTQGLDESLSSWAGRLDEFRGATTEYDRMQEEYNQGVAADLARVKELSEIEGVKFAEIKEDLFESLPYDSIAEMEAAVEDLGAAIDEHFNNRVQETLESSSEYLADLTGKTSEQDRALRAMSDRFDQYREELVEANASQEELNRLTRQRTEAEEYLKQQYEEGTAAANDYANALSNMEIKERQAAIAGRSGEFQLQRIASDFGWQEKYGGIPSAAEIRRGINWAANASPEELRAKADQFGITTEELLDNVAMLDDALDNMGSSADNAARASERAAEALSRQAETLQNQISSVESIQGLINNIMGTGNLSPVTSMEFFDRRYEQLLADAKANPNNTQIVGAYTNFAQQYLDFAQTYGGDYAGAASDVLSDLRELQDGIAGDRTLSDLYDQLSHTNDRLEYIRENTRETVETMADAFTQALEEAIGTSEEAPWAENWNMGRLLSDFQGGLSTGIANYKEDPRGMEAMQGFLGGDSGTNITQALGGGYTASFYGPGGLSDILGSINFADPSEVTAEMLWDLMQRSPTLSDYWDDFQKYYLGSYSGGGTVTGPDSGYTRLATFHGTEHIFPDNKLQDVTSLLAGILDVLREMYAAGKVLEVDGDVLGRIVGREALAGNEDLVTPIRKLMGAA